MIKVEGLEKHVGPKPILRGVSLTIPQGVVLGVIGASGSGKTTLLRCLNGLERIDRGTIECHGVTLRADLPESIYRRRVRELRRQVGMVFQHLHLFPHLSVLGNLTEAPVRVLKISKRDAERTALGLLETVGLGGAGARYPQSLSGGEQQRVAIARALAMRPKVLLFDEPTSALDPQRTAGMRALLRRFADDGHTMVIVSHSVKFLDGLADFLLLMEGGQAIEQGTADQVLRAPQDERTKNFLSHT
ncbi:MAG TPA: amino acid ABC transporter ATP-binding protein [Pyrinomonadaceae bacterium]|jgi:ABC-type polar amino acid transport system ATPase subunit|nr:amino acid ABC transporter ATP-binding protein [Pyrinomonadaceae bacterium]